MQQQILFSLPPVLIITTFCITIFVAVLVIRDKIRGKNDKTTYNQKRTISVYIAAIIGYVGAIFNKILLLIDKEITLQNLLIVVFFYVSIAILSGYFAFKKPVKEDTNGYEAEDYHAVQFIVVLISSFLPLIILR